jgi:hypothetical protein
MNVNPGVTASIDICRFQVTEDNQWYVLFPTERGWRRILFRMKVESNTVLKGKLLICPSNDFPKILTFTLYLYQNKPKLLIGDKWMSKLKKIAILRNSYFLYSIYILLNTLAQLLISLFILNRIASILFLLIALFAIKVIIVLAKSAALPLSKK